MVYNIGIDGLCASGKDTTTDILIYCLSKLDSRWRVVDTSGIYRAVSRFLDEHHAQLGIDSLDRIIEKIESGCDPRPYFESLTGIASNISVSVEFKGDAQVSCNDIHSVYTYEQLQESRIGTFAGFLGTVTPLRPYLTEQIREQTTEGFCILQGRDTFHSTLNHHSLPPRIGLYIWADLETRVTRRILQKGYDPEDASEYARFQRKIKERDMRDTEKTGSGLPATPEIAESMGYHVINTTYNDEYQAGVQALTIVCEEMGWEIDQERISELVEEALTK